MLRRFSVLVALLILVLPSVSVAQAAPAQRKHRPVVVVTRHTAPGTTAGTLTNINGSVLTLTAAGNVTYTVNVSTTTKIVRLYNGPSALDEMSPGDALLVRGTTVTTGTINATWIKDQSIQRKYTRVVGTIQSVGANSATIMAVRDERGPTPFALGQTITLTIGSSTRVISPTGTGTTVYTGTAGLPILSGDMGGKVTVLGVYNRLQNAFTTVDRISLLKGAKLAYSREVEGTLVGEFGATAPATLTVQTGRFGLITVTVAASPTVSIVRRYNGHSALDELSPGDHLLVRGGFVDAKTYAASWIKDISIQEAATRAVLKITAVNSTNTSFTGTVLRDVNSVRAPFDEGATVTVMVGASTKILVPATTGTGETTGTFANLAAGQKVTVLGVYNRKLHTYTTTNTVRVHRS